MVSLRHGCLSTVGPEPRRRGVTDSHGQDKAHMSCPRAVESLWHARGGAEHVGGENKGSRIKKRRREKKRGEGNK